MPGDPDLSTEPRSENEPMADQTARETLANLLYYTLAYNEDIDVNDCQDAIDAIEASPWMAERLAKTRADALEEAAHRLSGVADIDAPGWDDRKELLDVWQEHAPLPDIGLRDGIFDALIAVAGWGYRRRLEQEGHDT